LLSYDVVQIISRFVAIPIQHRRLTAAELSERFVLACPQELTALHLPERSR